MRSFEAPSIHDAHEGTFCPYEHVVKMCYVTSFPTRFFYNEHLTCTFRTSFLHLFSCAFVWHNAFQEAEERYLGSLFSRLVTSGRVCPMLPAWHNVYPKSMGKYQHPAHVLPHEPQFQKTPASFHFFGGGGG